MNPSLLCLVAMLMVASITTAQNRARFHHKISLSQIESGYLPLVYNDGTSDFKLYQHLSDSVHRVCSDLDGIVSVASGTVSIDFFSVTGPSPDSPCINNTTKLGTFTLDLKREKLGDPTFAVWIPFRAWTWSLATVPFRYRFKTDSSFATVSTALSASVSFGRTFGWSNVTHRAMNNYSVTVGPFVGVTSVDLKKPTVKNPAAWTSDRTNFAVSYGLSVTLARNNFGIVISAGADRAYGEQHEEWSYQNKPWIGIGINASMGLF
jgi:hypothetical protein